MNAIVTGQVDTTEIQLLILLVNSGLSLDDLQWIYVESHTVEIVIHLGFNQVNAKFWRVNCKSDCYKLNWITS